MIILFGAAGSGKSVQGQALAEKYDWRWMSVGQLLRECDDPEMNEIMKRGELVPDDFVVKMMHDGMMKEVEKNRFVVLDGYPRDEWQAKWIVENGDEKYLDGAIIIDVDHDELWRRLQERGRADDTREAIEKRWKIFEQSIYSMAEILSNSGVKVTHINGVGTIGEVSERIENVLREWGIIDTQKR